MADRNCGWRKRKSLGAQHPAARRCRPRLEILEDRLAPAVTVSLTGTNLTVLLDSSTGQPQPAAGVTLVKNGGNLDLRDATNAPVAAVPLAAVTSIDIDGADNVANDLTLDYSAGVFTVPGTIAFHGGALPGTPSNSITIKGGSFDTDTFTYTSAHDGSVQLGTGGQLITYTNLTPLNNTGTAADVIFNLPAGQVGASLQDDGTTGNNTVQLFSPTASFETTTFAVPTNSLTVNAGGGTDTITTAANFSGDFHAGLTLNGTAATDTVLLNALTLDSGTASLAVTGNTIVVSGPIITGGAGTAGSVRFTANTQLTQAPSATLTASGGVVQTGAGAVSLAASITTTNAVVSFASPVTLAGDVSVGAGSGNVNFSGTVNGAFALTVNSSGATTFGGAVGGATPLTSLTTDAGGTASLLSVTTTGAQNYGDATVTFNGTYTSTNNSAFTVSNASVLAGAVTVTTGAGAIRFGGRVNGGFAFVANSSGTTIFFAAVGGTTPLASLTTDAVGRTDLNGGTVTTTGGQTYNDAVILTADNTLTDGGTGIFFGNTVDGDGSGPWALTAVTTTAAAQILFAGTVGGTNPLNSLTVNDAGPASATGAIAGAATTLTKQGAGTFTLTGANTYGGLTTISGGTLQIGNGATAGTLGAGSVTDNANLAFDRSDTISIGNAISGSGSLTQAGTGTLVLTNTTSSYSGGTTIRNGGTMQIDSDAELGAATGSLTLNGGTLRTVTNSVTSNRPITVSAASTLDVAAGTTLTLGGAINGNGSLTKTNTGNLTLTGSGSYAGTLTFVNGTLLVTGSEPNAAVIVNGSTTVTGTGRIGTLTGAAGAVLSPGASAAAGNPGTFGSGTNTDLTGFTYLADLDGAAASQADTLNVTGNVNLGNATLTLTLIGNFATTVPTNTVFTLVSATGALSGTFAGHANATTFTQNGLPFRIDYSSTAATLTYLNTPPTNVTVVPAPATVNENDLVNVSGTFTDPDPLDTHTVTVDWGDGTAPTVLSLAANVLSYNTAPGQPHRYLDNQPGNAPFTITVTVTDPGGGRGTGTGAVTVNNVAPASVALTPTPSPSNENGTITLSGTFTDPGTLDTHTVVIAWGDGSANTTLRLGANVLAFSTTHQYLDNQANNAPFTIRATVTDKDGGSGSGSSTQVVNNAAPANVVVAFAPASINENDTVTLNGSFTDPGTLDTHTVVIDWKDGSSTTTLNLAANVLTFSASHKYLDNQQTNQPFAVSATVTDKDGGTGSGTGSLPVANVAPSAVTLQTTPGALNENGTVSLNGTFTDPGTLDTHTVVITWGDGSANTTLNLAANVLTFGASHQYLDNGPGNAPVTISVTVTDKDGGSGTGTTTLAVNNVAPTNLALTLNPAAINENDTTTLSGSFADPGTLDTHTVIITWGDGSANTTLNLAANVLTFSAAHRYLDNAPGNAPFPISVTLTDKDGGTATAAGALPVNNVPPSNVGLTLSATTINQGDSVTLNITFSDPGTLDTHTVVIAWGDGTANTTLNLAPGVTNASSAHAFQSAQAGNAPFSITVGVTDKDGGSAFSPTAQVFVQPAAPPAAIAGFVAALYRDVLGRPPDLPSYNFWITELRLNVFSRGQVANFFLTSVERRGLEVDQFYRQVLGRPADPVGKSFFVAALLNGTSEANLVIALATSPEFTAQFPDNFGFVSALYQRVLGRPAGATSLAELLFQTQALNSGQTSRGLMALSFLASTEAYVGAITSLYASYLGRPVDPAGLQLFLGLVQSGRVDPVGLQTIFLASGEYFLRAGGVY